MKKQELQYFSDTLPKGNHLAKYYFSSNLNHVNLAALYENDIDHALEMFELYIEILPEGLKEIKDLCAAKSYAKLATALHRMKSCFDLVGLNKMEIGIKFLEKKVLQFVATGGGNHEMLTNCILMFVETCNYNNKLVISEICRMKSYLTNKQ